MTQTLTHGLLTKMTQGRWAKVAADAVEEVAERETERAEEASGRQQGSGGEGKWRRDSSGEVAKRNLEKEATLLVVVARRGSRQIDGGDDFGGREVH